MKKFILMVAMLLATNVAATASDAANSNVNVVEAYDINVNINSLARYLELSNEQIEYVELVQKVFTENLRRAAVSTTDESRKMLVNSTINYALRNMGNVLDKKQYKKYVTVLNVTLENRGIKN